MSINCNEFNILKDMNDSIASSVNQFRTEKWRGSDERCVNSGNEIFPITDFTSYNIKSLTYHLRIRKTFSEFTCSSHLRYEVLMLKNEKQKNVKVHCVSIYRCSRSQVA